MILVYCTTNHAPLNMICSRTWYCTQARKLSSSCSIKLHFRQSNCLPQSQHLIPIMTIHLTSNSPTSKPSKLDRIKGGGIHDPQGTHDSHLFPVFYLHSNLIVRVFLQVSSSEYPYDEGATLKYGRPLPPPPFPAHLNTLMCNWLVQFDQYLVCIHDLQINIWEAERVGFI